jgi:hypothetical protein
MQRVDGVQKGIRKILSERGLWVEELKKDDALAVLKAQEDFDPEKLSLIWHKS